jgi:hypothetical protein
VGSITQAQEDARKTNGRFGEQQHTAPEVEITAAGEWQLRVKYSDGESETFLLGADGTLNTPVRSGHHVLRQLQGFRQAMYSPAVDVPLTDAVSGATFVESLHPVFLTTEEQTTTLNAATTSFIRLV